MCVESKLPLLYMQETQTLIMRKESIDMIRLRRLIWASFWSLLTCTFRISGFTFQIWHCGGPKGSEQDLDILFLVWETLMPTVSMVRFATIRCTTAVLLCWNENNDSTGIIKHTMLKTDSKSSHPYSYTTAKSKICHDTFCYCNIKLESSPDGIL